jgi:uncharacterized membrane protein
MNDTTEERKNRETGQTAQHAPADLNVYADVYNVLLGGMVVSTALFCVGIVRALLRPQFVPLTPDWIKQHYRWPAIAEGIRSFDPTVLMMIATVLLILTPIARVIVSVYAFAVDHDRKFVLVTLSVLVVIVFTVVLGLFGLK